MTPTESSTLLGKANAAVYLYNFVEILSSFNLDILTATALFVSGDPAAVGEARDNLLYVPTDANEVIVDASAGTRYTLVVLSDGFAAAGGVADNDYQGHFGILDVKEGINELSVIETFIDLDGNELAVPPTMSKVYAGVEIITDTGLIHSLFIDEDGNVYSTGNNDKGQLCLGDTDSRGTPHQIDLPEPAVSAAVGGDFTLILTESGKVSFSFKMVKSSPMCFLVVNIFALIHACQHRSSAAEVMSLAS